MNRWKTWAFRSQRIHNGARRCGRIGLRFAGLDKLVHLIGLGEVVLRLGRGVAGAPSPACPGQRLEPQRGNGVTRRVVAQRRSRASGLTRLSAKAIRGLVF